MAAALAGGCTGNPVAAVAALVVVAAAALAALAAGLAVDCYFLVASHFQLARLALASLRLGRLGMSQRQLHQ